MGWFEKFKEAYNDYPSQDNEGYVPDRGGFKCGFSSAWRIQEEKIEKYKKTLEAIKLHGNHPIKNENWIKYCLDLVEEGLNEKD